MLWTSHIHHFMFPPVDLWLFEILQWLAWMLPAPATYAQCQQAGPTPSRESNRRESKAITRSLITSQERFGSASAVLTLYLPPVFPFDSLPYYLKRDLPTLVLLQRNNE